MSIQSINSEILSGTFTNAQLSSIVDAVRFARAQLGKRTKYSLRIGDAVKFTSNRNGVTYTGKIDKIKIKNILVTTPQGRFNVPANMLEAA